MFKLFVVLSFFIFVIVFLVVVFYHTILFYFSLLFYFPFLFLLIRLGPSPNPIWTQLSPKARPIFRTTFSSNYKPMFSSRRRPNCQAQIQAKPNAPSPGPVSVISKPAGQVQRTDPTHGLLISSKSRMAILLCMDSSPMQLFLTS